MIASTTIFQPSDLNQRGRTILDAAREGWVRLRDKDGVSLVMLPEQRVNALLKVVNAAANLLIVERALSKKTKEDLDLSDFGEWTWLRYFDNDDLREFVNEIQEALIVAARQEDTILLDEALHSWKVTAEVLEDPRRREVLLGPASEEDFVEVSRPE